MQTSPTLYLNFSFHYDIKFFLNNVHFSIILLRDISKVNYSTLYRKIVINIPVRPIGTYVWIFR